MGDQERLVAMLFLDAPAGITESMLHRHGVTARTLELMLITGELRTTVDRFARINVTERRFHFVRTRSGRKLGHG